MLRKQPREVALKLQEVAENLTSLSTGDNIVEEAERASTPKPSSANRIVRIGIIGCGEVTQVVHIPTLLNLSDHFRITYLCDISPSTASHCRSKLPPISSDPPTFAQITTSAETLCSSPDTDAVLVASYDAFHTAHALLALQNDKHVLVEKPLSLLLREIDVILEAEKSSKGRVFVGTMRRYAAAFADVVKEVGGMDKVLYAKVRDIIGPNRVFVGQSGMFPKKFDDVSTEDIEEGNMRKEGMLDEGLGIWGVEGSEETRRGYWLLGNLGSHSISALREILGMPQRCIGAWLGPSFSGTSTSMSSPPSPIAHRRTSSFSLSSPITSAPALDPITTESSSHAASSHSPFVSQIWSAMFAYPTFSVTYESGFMGVPTFDSHIEVFSENKIVRIQFDTPFVKGLPTNMIIKEKVGEDTEAYQERVVRRTYEDAYTSQWKEFHKCVTEGKDVKTSAEDARWDLEVFGMIVKAAQRS